MKTYAERLLKRLGDDSSWPGTALAKTFNDLQKQALDSIDKGTLGGSLSGMLLLHQLSEELLSVLLDLSHFYMQLRLFPLPYEPKRSKRRMYGQLLKELEETVWFQHRDFIVKKAGELNEIRIPLVHGLTKSGAIHAAIDSVKKAKDVYGEFSMLAIGAYLLFTRKIFDEFIDTEDFPPKDVVYVNDFGEEI
jgi:hypothetical protein